MPIDTQFPPWLAARYAPQAESPWIINAIQVATQRERMRQTLPLEIQQAQLRNQQMQVDTEHQGLANEALSRQISQEAADLPVFNEWFQRNQNDFSNATMPNVVTPRYQKAALDTIETATKGRYAQSQQLQMINRLRQAHALNLAGADTQSAIIEGPRGPGDIDFDQSRMNELQTQVNTKQQQEKIEQIEARNSWRFDPITGEPLAGQGVADVMPKLQTVMTSEGPREFFVNPKTGHMEMISKGPTKAQFISENLFKWMDMFSLAEADAAKRLSDFYDTNFSGQKPEPTAATSTNAWKNIGAFKVRVK